MTTLKYRDPADQQLKAITYRTRDHSEMTGRDDDDHTQYLTTARADASFLRRTGGSMNPGNLGIDEAASRDQWNGGLLLHYPGVSWARLKSGHDGNGGYHLRVEKGQDQATLVPVFAGSPPSDSHLATVGYHKTVWAPRVNGPHGGNWGYQNVNYGAGWTPMYGGAIYQAPYAEPGLIKCYAFAYGRITYAYSGANIYFGLRCRWADGLGGTFTNGDIKVRTSRMAVHGNNGDGYESLFAEGWVVNRPGIGLVYSAEMLAENATAGGQETFAFGGQYRLTSEFWPYADIFGGLNVGWHSW